MKALQPNSSLARLIIAILLGQLPEAKAKSHLKYQHIRNSFKLKNPSASLLPKPVFLWGK